ncbi:hypothetical protein SCHPADRAFT_1000137 [Schizopora paradoxa]|uniref:BTB domain-containing protein n=1 Tax=Schizopora paradoxa TaxID=27342 RepID=A0A0H2RCR4_9AGAM|nr:hypothetical protein SCHPADRAFT_1000137 [Schizopora paradoxa]
MSDSESAEEIKSALTSLELLKEPCPRSKDDEFYMTLVTFEVQNMLFRVPVAAFETGSEIFRDMFSLPTGDIAPAEGISDDSPIELKGVKAGDFRALLKFLYPRKHGVTTVLSQTEWIGTHFLSIMWDFQDALEASKAFLFAMDDSITKFELATKYGYDDWLRRAYKELAERSDALSFDEARRIGLASASHVAHLRELRFKALLDHRVWHPGARSTFTPKRIVKTRCPQCLKTCDEEKTLLPEEVIPVIVYRCSSCSVAFYEAKTSIDIIISTLLDEQISDILS